MNDITGYNYIDEPATELLEELPIETQESLLKIFKQIHSAGKADGFTYGVESEKYISDR
jgi:hypothetical protein|tara:strand:+ start:364 stop:540 length:177 start_codon:yes stop_codon:yes gene_type:complete